MNFCKLTMEDGRSTYVNLDRVCEILTMANGQTRLVFKNNTSDVVLETQDQIMNWVSTGRLE
jgi:hypothetical protein